MEDTLTFQKALDAAYRFLTARPHTRLEIRRKLSRKGYDAAVIASVEGELAAKGYLNEQDMALRWAQALAREKLWGPQKIAAYLMQKGIGRSDIDQVQRLLWQEFDEQTVAARAVQKRFGRSEDEAVRSKKAAFLKSRGFSAEVIYKISKQPAGDDW